MGIFFVGIFLLSLYQNIEASEPFIVNCQDSEQFENPVDFEKFEKNSFIKMHNFKKLLEQILEDITETSYPEKSWFTQVQEKAKNLFSSNQEKEKTDDSSQKMLQKYRPKTFIHYDKLESTLQKNNFEKNITTFLTITDFLPRTTKSIEDLYTTEENREMGKELTEIIKHMCESHHQKIHEQHHELFFNAQRETQAIGTIIQTIFKTADQIYQTYPLQEEETNG